MDSFVDKIIGDIGCNLDATSTNNPLAQWANSIMDNNIGFQGNSSSGAYNLGQASYEQSNYDIIETNNINAPNYSSNSQFDKLWDQSINMPADMQSNGSYMNQQNQGMFQGSMYGGSHAHGLSSMMMFGSPHMFQNNYSSMNNRQHQDINTSASTATSASSSSSIQSQSVVGNSKELSIDELLKESMKNGQLSSEELNNIHRIIGYDQQSFNQLSVTDTRQVSSSSSSSSSATTVESNANDMHTLNGVSKLGYTQAWEKLPIRLENLDSFTNTVTFHSVEQNPYLNTMSTLSDTGVTMSAEELLHVSQELFRQGDIKNAILASEANVQKNKEYSEGWRVLGVCFAENEDDKQALLCLKKAVDLDPFNIEAQLALGISYVNEVNFVNALAALKNWILHNPQFHDMTVNNNSMDEYSDGTMIDDVMQLMLSAYKLDSTNADVNIVLGVLYNISSDYNSALQHFNQALTERPDDYSLLNKLGATLANNKRGSEAIEFYAKALAIRPKYVRGWVNLGISYMNIGDDATEASKAFLQALHLTASDSSKQISHVWDYMRMALTAAGRLELVEWTSRESTTTVNMLAQALQVELLDA